MWWSQMSPVPDVAIGWILSGSNSVLIASIGGLAGERGRLEMGQGVLLTVFSYF